MDRREVLRRFERLKTWAKGDERAPHKPLLVLYAIGCWQRGQEQLPYSDVHETLTSLLKEFGPPRKKQRPEHPFWRLQKDEVWEVTASGEITLAADGTPTRSTLLDAGASGSFPSELQVAFRKDPTLPKEIARLLLDAHFPKSLHEDIADACGLTLSADRATGGGRDPHFRERVLKAYEFRCAVCRVQILLSGAPVGLEAAHIKWHQASGPATLPNGICLCVLHHKLFDLGAFTLGEDLSVLVSDEATWPDSSPDLLLAYHGNKLSPPIHAEDRPGRAYLKWHHDQVFRGRSRPV